MPKTHHIIYVPGLNDQNPFSKLITNTLPLFWKQHGFTGHIITPHWSQGKSFEPKLKRIIKKIDELAETEDPISLIGQSAGGSAVLNAFCARKSVLTGVVNVVGRLRAGENVRPSLEWATRKSPAFKESVTLFEKENEPKLTREDRKRILTARPWWDEIVPAGTVPVHGATNLVSAVPEHCVGGTAICSLYAKAILQFLTKLEESSQRGRL